VDQSGNQHDGNYAIAVVLLENELLGANTFWGALNLDGQVNISDVLQLINHILRLGD